MHRAGAVTFGKVIVLVVVAVPLAAAFLIWSRVDQEESRSGVAGVCGEIGVSRVAYQEEGSR